MAKRSAASRTRTRGGSRPRGTPTAFAVPSDRIERGLVTGESQGLLEDYFGSEAYRQLRDLALDASTRAVRGGPRVLILPGIMGSTLARKGMLGVEDTLWIDPVEIALGRLTELTLGETPSVYHASGVILFTYLKLKLRLRIAGFDAGFFPFDWRQSLADLGASLAAALRRDSAAEVQLVAHSMGGLVARAALATPAGAKVKRLLMLGTPNYGSYAVVQALRGTYDAVRNLARLDSRHSPVQLAGDIFGTFPGLHEMLPAPGRCETVNLYDPDAWPASDPRPRPERLAGVKRVLDKLAPADQRFHLIAGVNQQTVVGLRKEDGDFVYDFSADGDGTVPLSFARLDGIPAAQTWYVEEQHGNLPNNGEVEASVIDILSTGTTLALPSTPPAPSRAITTVAERQLRALRAPSISGSEACRHLIDSFAAPMRAAAAAPAQAAPAASATAAGDAAPLQNLVIGRRRQRRLEITLANGSLTEADSEAYVLGVFRNVAPSGAALSIDQRLDGAIADFFARRIFSGDVGELFTLPASRRRLGADLVVFAGLGSFDHFNPDVHQLVAENIVRMMARSHVTGFATVLLGAGAGQSVPAVLRNLLTGFLRALRDADPRQRFRGITFCETDPGRYAEMKAALLSLAGSALFDDVELTLDEVRLPSPAPVRAAAAAGPEPLYAMIRQDASADAALHFRVSVLGSGMKAAVVSLPQAVESAKLDELLRTFDAVAGTSRPWEVGAFGEKFAALMLPPDVREVLAASPDRHLVLVHDAASSRIPWETLKIGDWQPSLAAGLSRRYMADDLHIASFLEQRRAQPGLKLLLIVDPTQNLPGAALEGDRILKLAAGIDGLEVTELRAARATKPAVLAALRSGRFDIVHYAGHAFFDPKNRARSGLLLAGDNVLSGADLAGISNLPFLVFFNACQAGRVRGANPPQAPSATRAAETSAGLAETMMRGGIANYLSTYWPVSDEAAETFASTFYHGVLGGAAIGAALLDARKAVEKLGARDWADYILYGSYDFILKRRA